MRARFAIVSSILAGMLAAATYAAAGPLDAPLPGMAFIRDAQGRDIDAGDTASFRIAVHNFGPKPLDWIALSPGNGLKLLAPATATPGWTAALRDNRIVFTGGTVPVGSLQSFNVTALGTDAGGATPVLDSSTDWTVEVSGDGGANKRLFEAPEPTPDRLNTIIRVLRINAAPRVASPAGAADGTATAGQTVGLVASVRNRGPQSLVVEGTFSGTNAAGFEQPAAKTIAPGATEIFEAAAIVGEDAEMPTNITFAAKTADDGAVAHGDGDADAIDVETPAAFQCTALTPDSTNATPRAHTVKLAKTGQPAVSVTAASLRVDSDVPFTTGATPVSLARDDQAREVTLPAGETVTGAHGEHATTLLLAGTDANGAPLPSSVPCPNILVDLAGPELTIDAVLPPLPTNPEIRQSAVKSGDPVSFAGTIADAGGCRETTKVLWASLQQYDAAGTRVQNDVVDTSEATVTAGESECAYSGDILIAGQNPAYRADAVSITVWAIVEDDAGNRASRFSEPVRISLAPPEFAAATTTQTTLEVLFSECLYGTSTGADWSVGDHAVQSVTPIACTEAATDPRVKGVELTLPATETIGFNETPAVRYTRALPANVNPGYVNAAARPLADATTAEAIDGLASPQPQIVGVTPGTEFFTNGGGDGKPAIVLDGLIAGDRICAYQTAIATDNVLACADYSGTGTFELKSAVALSGEDRDIPIVVEARDANDNVSPAAEGVLHFDRTAPSLAQASIAGSSLATPLALTPDATIEAVFAEPVAGGSNHADDWDLLDANGNRVTGVIVTSVDACQPADGSCRLISLDAGGTTRWQNVRQIRYAPGSAASAYSDRAGNAAGSSTAGVA